jgi:hypothetical protein
MMKRSMKCLETYKLGLPKDPGSLSRGFLFEKLKQFKSNLPPGLDVKLNFRHLIKFKF